MVGLFGQYVFGLLWAICIWVVLGNMSLGCFGNYVFGSFWELCILVVLGIMYFGCFSRDHYYTYSENVFLLKRNAFTFYHLFQNLEI